MHEIERYAQRASIAYFTMEIALRDEMHTFAGGLGILAGDMARSAADLNLPIVFVSLLSREGYVRQYFDSDGVQVNDAAPWKPEEWSRPLPAMIAVEVEGRDVWIRPWLYRLAAAGGSVAVLLLDTKLERNDPADRCITDRLYGGADIDRLKQEIVLGIGGELVLRALGFRIRTYHLNEGHAALLPLKLLKDTMRWGDDAASSRPEYHPAGVRERCVFTTHTPIESAFDRFDYSLLQRLLGDLFDIDDLKQRAGADRLNMTRLALNLSGYVNGVAERHAETAARIFPGYTIRSITNGVHVQTWTHVRLAEIYNKRFPHWPHEPEVLGLADQIPDDELWAAHQEAKRELLEAVADATDCILAPELPVIGYARRMTAYKRPDLLFADLGRLREAAREHPFQVILAGTAHPADKPGLELIQTLQRDASLLGDAVPTIFLTGYDMALAKRLVSGCDIWLNTPLPPLEASGTSGMKAALNGVLNLSVLDGWWVEGCVEGVTGWGIEGTGSSAAEELLDKLRGTVLPLYYNDRQRWIGMMKHSIGKLGPLFSSQRMIRRYATEAYLGA